MRRIVVMMLVTASFVLSVPALAASEYRLGVEDVVTLTVLRHPEFSGEFLIPADGVIELPAAGRVKASGMTAKELSDYVTKQLATRLRSPEVSLVLKTARRQQVFVLGSVKAPGVYEYRQGWRLAECLATAGGNLGDAVDCQVRLIKASTGEQQTARLDSVLAVGSTSNLAVDDGDVLSVESLRMLPVYVAGRVRAPGTYRLREDGGLLEAIALAGGTLDDAALSKVTVTHLSGKNETVDLVPLMAQGSSAANRKLEPGDLVIVPESNSKIAVLGNVLRPGYFALRDGEVMHVADALAMAGGTARNSNLNEVAVVGMLNGQENRRICNLGQFFTSGDLTSNPTLKPGDVVFVAKSGRTDWSAMLSGLSVTTLLYNVLTR